MRHAITALVLIVSASAPASAQIYVAMGQSSPISYNGRTYSPDTCIGGSVSTTNLGIAPFTTPIFQSARYASVGFHCVHTLPKVGEYRVTLMFAEFGSGVTQPGQRVQQFSVDVGSGYVSLDTSIDIVAAVGILTQYSKTYTFNATTTSFQMSLNGLVGSAWLNGYSINYVGSATSASTVVSACQDLTESGTYVLSQNIVATRSPCFPFLGDYITLDCQGRSIVAYNNTTPGSFASVSVQFGNAAFIGRSTITVQSPTVQNCTFLAPTGSKGSYAVYASGTSEIVSPVVKNSTFTVETVEGKMAPYVYLDGTNALVDNNRGIDWVTELHGIAPTYSNNYDDLSNYTGYVWNLGAPALAVWSYSSAATFTGNTFLGSYVQAKGYPSYYDGTDSFIQIVTAYNTDTSVSSPPSGFLIANNTFNGTNNAGIEFVGVLNNSIIENNRFLNCGSGAISSYYMAPDRPELGSNSKYTWEFSGNIVRNNVHSNAEMGIVNFNSLEIRESGKTPNSVRMVGNQFIGNTISSMDQAPHSPSDPSWAYNSPFNVDLLQSYNVADGTVTNVTPVVSGNVLSGNILLGSYADGTGPAHTSSLANIWYAPYFNFTNSHAYHTGFSDDGTNYCWYPWPNQRTKDPSYEIDCLQPTPAKPLITTDITSSSGIYLSWGQSAPPAFSGAFPAKTYAVQRTCNSGCVGTTGNRAFSTSSLQQQLWDQVIPGAVYNYTVFANDAFGGTSIAAAVTASTNAGVPDVRCPVGTGTFNACYFDQTSFLGPGTSSAAEGSTFNHQWGTSAPVGSVSANKFSARWVGDFSLTDSSGGVWFSDLTWRGHARILIDGYPMGNPATGGWVTHSGNTTGTFQITGVGTGTHRVVIEYDTTGETAGANIQYTGLYQ